VEFRKRLDDEVMMQINEMIIAYNMPDDPGTGEPKNRGTIIMDATCAP